MRYKPLIFALAAGALLLLVFAVFTPPVTLGGPDLHASPTLAPGDALATRQADAQHSAADSGTDSNSVSEGELCAVYPQYCVPLAGGGDKDSPLAESESAAVREVHEADVVHADGVVRGITRDGSFFLGDPGAPVRFRVFHNFTCGHCREYHQHDLARFVEDYVLAGQAVLEVNLLAFGSQPYSDNAAFGALCAGEQGAFWEMQHELFTAGSQLPPQQAFDMTNIRDMADAMGLDGAAVEACIMSARYRDLLDEYDTHALDCGVTGTPSMLIYDPGTGAWTAVNRRYDTLADLTAIANQ